MVKIKQTVRFTVLSVMMLSTFGISCATAEVAVQTSHVGAVSAMAYHPPTESIVSGGTDGRLKVWGIEQQRIIRTLQTGTAAVTRLAVHPERPEAATVIRDAGSTYQLQVWNLDRGRMLFSEPLQASPTVVDYSPSGDFIVVAESRMSGMRYFDSRDGSSLPYPAVPQGIVTYATVAASERTIMTYVAGDGTIRYWSLADQNILAEAQTLFDMNHMQVLQNKRYAAAVNEGDLVVVDIVEGTLVDRVPVGRVNYLTVAPQTGQIVLLETRAGGRRVTIYEFDGDFLNRERILENPTLDGMNVVALAGSSLYGGSDNGELYVFRSSDGGEETLVRNVVAPIHDIALLDDTLFVNVGADITTIRTEFFTASNGRIDRVDTVETSEVENPLGSPVNMSSISDGSLVLWGTEGEQASTLFRLAEDRTFEEVFSSDARIHAVEEFDGTLLLLNRADTLLRLSLADFEEEFRYSSLGMEAVAGTEEYGIVVGKSRSSSFGSAVLTIDPRTRETVGLETDAFLVFDVVYNRESGDLYALGITRENDTETTIIRFSGTADLTRRTTVLSLPGEYLEGNLVLDPESGALYTSIGRSGITRITGDEIEVYGGTTHASQRLESSGGFLWSINRDGSATLWEPGSNEATGDLYFFKDGGWALITAAGRFYASSEQAEQFVAAVNANTATESFRLTLPD